LVYDVISNNYSVHFNYDIMKAKIIILIALSIAAFSCKKNDFLDKKPNSNIVVPRTLDDFTKLLDNNNILYTPALSTVSTDESIILSKSDFDALILDMCRNAYIWKKDIYNGKKGIKDWNTPFQAIFYANIVLNGLTELPEAEQNSTQGKAIKGNALFLRGYSYYNLAQTFCPSYNRSTADKDSGLPLRLLPGIDEIKPRSTLAETYSQIFSDLNSSIDLLPPNLPTVRSQASKPAVYALLSRIYLNMHDYLQAETFAIKALALYNKIVDFNDLDTTKRSSFSNNSDETILYSVQNNDFGQINSIGYTGYGAKVNPALIELYEPGDIRKAIFFSKQLSNGVTFYNFKRGFSGNNSTPFSGLASDELYLNVAECLARENKLSEAEAYLNALLSKRYKTGTFIPYNSSDKDAVLSKILLERKKELVFRGIRWADLKRLNQEGANISLTRNLDGTIYSLSPNDPRYIMPIPDDEIALSHISQNPR